MKEKQVKTGEAQGRRTWRLKTRCADPKYGNGRRRTSAGRLFQHGRIMQGIVCFFAEGEG